MVLQFFLRFRSGIAPLLRTAPVIPVPFLRLETGRLLPTLVEHLPMLKEVCASEESPSAPSALVPEDLKKRRGATVLRRFAFETLVPNRSRPHVEDAAGVTRWRSALARRLLKRMLESRRCIRQRFRTRL